MTRLFPEPPPEVRGPIESVLRQAVDGGAPAPPWIVLEDNAQEWVRQVAALSRVDRARGVIAASSDGALAIAVRLGLGGAFWLPPSTVCAAAAFEAAARGGEVCDPDARLADLVAADGRRFLVAGWINRRFWRCQLGEPEMAAWLVDLATELEVVPAVVPWPALVLAERAEQEIRDAWNTVSERRRATSEGLAVVTCQPVTGHCGVAANAIRALLDGESESKESAWGEPRPQPVFELPSGRWVGCWHAAEQESADTRVWKATPQEPTSAGFRWRLTRRDDTIDVIDDVLDSSEVTFPATRISGWASITVGPGRPAGLLVERLASAAAKENVPLWVPNIGPEALDLLLRLPGTFWVDGPAAPRARDVENGGD
jgi:hypothetical protein